MVAAVGGEVAAVGEEEEEVAGAAVGGATSEAGCAVAGAAGAAEALAGRAAVACLYSVARVCAALVACDATLVRKELNMRTRDGLCYQEWHGQELTGE